MLTGYATVQSAVEAIKEGAFDYIQKPFSAEQLRVVIERALKQKRLVEENRNLRMQLETTYNFENIIGTSEAIRAVLEIVKKDCKERGKYPDTRRERHRKGADRKVRPY